MGTKGVLADGMCVFHTDGITIRDDVTESIRTGEINQEDFDAIRAKMIDAGYLKTPERPGPAVAYGYWYWQTYGPHPSPEPLP